MVRGFEEIVKAFEVRDEEIERNWGWCSRRVAKEVIEDF